MVSMVNIKQKILQNLFHTILNNSINKKTAPPPQKKKRRRSKIGEGGLGVGLTAVKDSIFFTLSLDIWKFKIHLYAGPSWG